MNLGFFTAPFQNIDLLDIADWGVSENFKSLEIACWPVTNLNQRRYAGTSHIDVKNITKNEACELADQLCQKGLTISGLGYYPNVMDPDPTHQELTLSHLSKVINCASWMNVPIVNTFCGGNSNLNIEENWEMAKTIWPDTISHALDLGVKITFENCPMIFSYNEWPGGHNIAYSPMIWRRIIEEWNGNITINFDPSHLVWQMIDQSRFISEFGSFFSHIHAKDLEIDDQGLYERGVLSSGIGWQIPRIPGLGQVNWSNFFSKLYESPFDGPVIIEHEDRNFEGSEKNIKRGFILAKEILSPYII